PARARALFDVRAVAKRELDVEPARVPGLARHRTADQPLAPARLDAADLVDSRADLGHPWAQAGRGRRRSCVPDRHVRRTRPRLPRDRPLHARSLRGASPQERDAGAAMNSVRIFFIGGYLAYRALFNWIHWTMYVPTMLGGPIFQILFFAYVGRYAGL